MQIGMRPCCHKKRVSEIRNVEQLSPILSLLENEVVSINSTSPNMFAASESSSASGASSASSTVKKDTDNKKEVEIKPKVGEVSSGYICTVTNCPCDTIGM
jgi:hypothetical protein